MRKISLRTVTLAIMAVFLPLFVRAVPPQQATGSSQSQVKEITVHRLEFTVQELENGKKVNSRSYTMLLARDEHHPRPYGQIRVGSKVPFATESNKFEYIDIGMNIDCALEETDSDYVGLSLTVESSSVAADRLVGSTTQNPIVRQVRSSLRAGAPIGKPTIISELDDVATNRRFQIEVTVTKVK